MASALSHWKSKLRALQPKLQQEIQSNARMVPMLWLIVYLAMGYLVLGMYDTNQVLRASTQQLSGELARANAVAGASVWQRRFEREEQSAHSLIEKCWVAPNKGIASADMQTVLQQVAANHRLENVRLTMAVPEEHEVSGRTAWFIRAQVRARANKGNVPPMVFALEEPAAFFAVERVRYVAGRGAGTLDLTVAACVLEEAS